MKKPRYYKYVGPKSTLIGAIGEDNNKFRRKEGFYISPGEEILVKASPEVDSLFVPLKYDSNVIESN